MKKRISAFALAIMFLLVLAEKPASLAIETYDVISFSADTAAIETQRSETVGFTAELDRTGASFIDVKDEEGNRVARLYDNGLNGDEQANDGVYYGESVLSGDEVGLSTYSIDMYGAEATCDIKFYRQLTDADMKVHDAVWSDIDAIENTLENTKSAENTIYTRVFEYLESSDDVAEVWFENDTTINFMLTSGIGNIYTRFDEASKYELKGAPSNVDAGILYDTASDSKEFEYIGNGDIGVWCPYYGMDSNFSMSYANRADSAVMVSGGRVDKYYGKDATCESFKKWGDYGVIMVDSHGGMYSGKSCICVPSPGRYEQTDMAEGHIYSMGGGAIAITGTFFLKYCGELPNSLVYIGICDGFKSTALSEPLIEAGAGFCMGYDESVSFDYDNKMMNAIFDLLCQESPETHNLYTVEEACLAAQQKYGDYDRYGGKRAKLIWYGNVNLIMQGIAVPVESVSIPKTSELYINNTVSLYPEVFPQNANRYTILWTSSDPTVASVDNYGNVTAHSAGTVKITCFLVDTALDEVNDIEASCTVSVLGARSVDGVLFDEDMIILAPGGGIELEADVYPQNASYRDILWSSSDTSVVTVDQNGAVTAVGEGSAAVIAKSKDGGFEKARVIRVVEPTINSAANYGNQTMKFINDSRYPWLIDIDPVSGRTALRSDIAGIDKGYTEFSTSKLSLTAGDKLSFSWKASTEDKYDKLIFKMNGNDITVLSGDTDWIEFECSIYTDGVYVFSWVYDKDSSDNMYNDCAWIDDIRLERVDLGTDTVNARFIDFDGSVIYSCDMLSGSKIDDFYPCSPYREGYTFVGWSVSGEIDSSTVATAVYAAGDLKREAGVHKVTFLGYNDVVLSVVYVNDGEMPDYPLRAYLETLSISDSEKLLFLGWQDNLTSITEDTVIRAAFGLLGDANGNHKIDSGDATVVLRVVTGIIDATDEMLILGDYNQNQGLDAGDATGILRYVVGAAA